jgi:cyclopropane fatty-acyl-phospholipid synthase-like methyltransferase
MAARSGSGADVIERWARTFLRQDQSVLDLGCGHGFPVSWVLSKHEVALFAIDSAPSLLAAYQKTIPRATVWCEDVRRTDLFGRGFDAVVMVGVIFLLEEEEQAVLLARISKALKPGGRLLFTAPAQQHEWTDVLTGQTLRSLGWSRYKQCLNQNGLRFLGSCKDKGGQRYIHAVDTRKLAA